jgi:hypothetical protein
MTTSKGTDVVSVEHISQTIHLLRGHRVILDKDLAAIYGVETRALNQAVKRNAERFPQDFRFPLTAEESRGLRSQDVTIGSGSGRHSKYSTYAFTEHGAIQAANVVSSSHAIAMSIYVVRAFVQLRGAVVANKELAQQLTELEQRVDSHDTVIVQIMKTIRELTNVPEARATGLAELEEKK